MAVPSHIPTTSHSGQTHPVCSNYFLPNRLRKASMFSLIRTPILILIAFVAGLLYERNGVTEACVNSGGNMRDGVCWNE